MADGNGATDNVSASAAGENDPVSPNSGPGAVSSEVEKMDTDEGDMDSIAETENDDMAAYYSAGSISPCYPGVGVTVTASSEVAAPSVVDDNDIDKRIMPPPPPPPLQGPHISFRSTPASPPVESYGDGDSPSRTRLSQEDEGEEQTTSQEMVGEFSQMSTGSSSNADTSGSQELSGASEDAVDDISHSEECHYYMWDVTHRASLLKDPAVEDFLVTTHKRRRGKKPKNYNKEAEEEQIRKEVQVQMASGIVREYLNGSKAVYEEFGDNQRKFCQCELLAQMKVDNDDNIDNDNQLME